MDDETIGRILVQQSGNWQRYYRRHVSPSDRKRLLPWRTCEHGGRSVNRIQRAVNDYMGDCTCSQSIVANFGPEFGLDRDLALRLAAGFGSGMGHGGICGAVTGAMMVLGLRYGQAQEDDPNGESRTHEAMEFFVEHFQARNGSILCRDLLGLNVETPEEMQAVLAQNPTQTRCPKYVKDAAQILELILYPGEMN